MPALLGWAAVLAALLLQPSGPVALAAILTVIVLCSFGVMQRANALARRLGEPYGALVLTFAITAIEIILVASVFLGDQPNPGVARDSTFSASMLLLNLVMGAAFLIGGLRHRRLAINGAGVSQYLVMLLVVGGAAFALPVLLAAPPSRAMQTAIAVLMLLTYGVFLHRQLGANRADFADASPETATDEPALPNAVWLIATIAPIVVLGQVMTPMFTELLPRPELAGLLIAVVILLPETFTTLSAGWSGQGQRVANLTLGALVSVVGVTVPVVLLLAAATGREADFVLSGAELTLLGMTLGLSTLTATARQATALHGVGHLAVFAMYVMVLVA
ncbi:calcium:proton antiporter [Corynebacterium guangdongense]|uniref:Ca2+:H+ antiporter n=1 Tax=Corynebacterium guangdongense TaxID=1783348 RepID=A0ABU2A0W4_9CORY|nr:calcium:proton antiporter [Corynebacterium guangdongense]MDR7330831.1 Ca2+:H+ antiporter [Corynebacterium guangdongense]WJZ16846.1 Sodium/proton antiporter ChaA [Corynebacterium guangdongense]